MTVLRKVAMGEIAPSRRLGAEIRFLLTAGTVGARSGFLGTMSIRDGEFVAAHLHPYSDEFVFLADGSLRLTLDGEEYTLERHEAILIPKGTAHRMHNVSGGPALVVFGVTPLAPSPEQGHVELEALPDPDAAPPRVGA
ncbi:cupin domain-containing protein [Paractinoplanes toevensis]|uniref:Cupin type-2 domain-containing protein n=1 Tax=Paractinoplanes toevensis TaxID=571911 RepID=A0A919TC72_9ACTN|nr:cupin domain-containing protein [Actinoplanes toevensis]GIM92602.1 hypothetical protein Ato02nite_043950 [Actinoplanes toevensis]